MLFATVLLLALTASWAAPGNVQWMEISPAQEMKPVHKVHPAYKGVVVDYSPYEDSWNNYKQIFNKNYEGAHEETYRFDVFIKNVMKIEYHNSKLYNNGLRSYYMGVNQFTDMDNMEFRKYNGFLRSRSSNATEECSSFLAAENIQLPTSVDWRNKGIVTEVKNQGQCGSCWSFSTTGSLEGQHAKKSGKLTDLSEQQLVDCSGKYGNHGCEGGLMDQAFLYIRDIGGLESETEYPYDAREETCEFQKSEVVATCTGCVDVTSEDEDALKKALGTVGPISVAIDASHPTFQSYKGGVYDEPECSSTELDHGVLAVGYGVKGGQDYWLVKNSWGTIWGDEGYIYMSRNKNNQCGIATTASYPLV